MNFFRRIFNRIRRVFGRYESAFQLWGDRSWLPAAVQDARIDADASTRLELVRRSRYWERNNPIVNRLVDVFEQFTVGASGLLVVPNSSDPQWNLAASDWWSGWSKFPDLTSKQPLGSLQSLMARSWFVDGEVFIYKTTGESGRPRVQIVEAHRVGTPKDKKTEEGKSIIDGIQVDPTGRPIGYWVRDAFEKERYDLVPADQIIHVFEPARPGQMRGLPFLYPVMNYLHDLDDLLMLEMKAAKASAEIANIETNPTGELNVDQARRLRFQIQSQNQVGNPVTKANDLYYTMTMGGRTIALRSGDTLKNFQIDRPTISQQWLWDYLVSLVCAGVGISKLLVIPTSMQGTVTRADLDIAAGFFRSRSAVLAAAMREVYVWVMGYAVRFDRSMDGAPSDLFTVTIRPPRAPNVDVGRNSAAMVAELEAGARTFEDVYAESGVDWHQALRQKAEEAAYIKSLCAEFGVEPSAIAAITAPKPEPQQAEPTKEAAAT